MLLNLNLHTNLQHYLLLCMDVKLSVSGYMKNTDYRCLKTKSEGKYLGLVKNKYWCEIFQDFNKMSYTNLYKNDVDTLISNSLMQCVTDMT